MDEKYYYDLINMDTIDYNGLKIYPIPFKEIKEEIGYDALMKCMIPFCLTKEYIEITNNCKLDDNFNVFEDIILKDENSLKNTAIVLKLYCKPEHIYYSKTNITLTDENDKEIFVLTKDNYDDVAEILLVLNSKSKLKAEKPPANMSERQRDVWEKLQAGRLREKQKNEVHFYDILNTCEYLGYYRIPMEELFTWTIWKIMNCYSTKTGMKIYDDDLSISIESHDLKPIQGNNHWSKKLMIRN